MNTARCRILQSYPSISNTPLSRTVPLISLGFAFDFQSFAAGHLELCYWDTQIYGERDFYKMGSFRVRFFKRMLDWIFKSERSWKRILSFFTKQINPRSFRITEFEIADSKFNDWKHMSKSKRIRSLFERAGFDCTSRRQIFWIPSWNWSLVLHI